MNLLFRVFRISVPNYAARCTAKTKIVFLWVNYGQCTGETDCQSNTKKRLRNASLGC